MPGKPTLGSVAKEAGVSIPTVSQVMRGTGRISEKTRSRVLKAAKKLHYLPDSRAASMRSGENREIGFVINQLMNPFNAEVISGVVELLEAEGYLVSILDTRDDALRQAAHLETFIRHGRGGLLWVPAMDTPSETYDMLKAHGVPTVSFLRNLSAHIDHVGIRNKDATLSATRYLQDLGHRHIAYLGGMEMTIVREERIAGYKQALASFGPVSPIVWKSGDTKPAGLHAMAELRQAHPEVTAVVCNGDMVALGACLELARAGLTAGQDISVVGFDGVQEAEVATPPLTTLSVSPAALGRKLAQALLNRKNEPDMPITTSEVSPRLIVRGTTGPAHGD